MSALDVSDAPGAGAPEGLCDLARRVPGVTRRVGSAHATLLLHLPWCFPARWFGSDLLLL